MKQFFLAVYTVFLWNIISCTEILKVKESELAVVEVPGKQYKLRIVYIPSNATIQSSIQVRKMNVDKSEELLQDYERYNYLNSYKLLSDTALLIVMKDTVSYLGSKTLDTMIVKIK